MKKYKSYSAILSILLVTSGQTFCPESLSPGISERLWLSMPHIPFLTKWAVRLGDNLLTDNMKYAYGATFALVTVIAGYKAYMNYYQAHKEDKIFEQVVSDFYSDIVFLTDESMEKVDMQSLTARPNCTNLALICSEYKKPHLRHEKVEEVFRERICPVFKKFSIQLNSEQKWRNFFSEVYDKSLGVRITSEFKQKCPLLTYRLIKYTCPNDVIMQPLKQLLVEDNKNNPAILKIVN